MSEVLNWLITLPIPLIYSHCNHVCRRLFLINQHPFRQLSGLLWLVFFLQLLQQRCLFQRIRFLKETYSTNQFGKQTLHIFPSFLLAENSYVDHHLMFSSNELTINLKTIWARKEIHWPHLSQVISMNVLWLWGIRLKFWGRRLKCSLKGRIIIMRLKTN